MFKHKNFQVSFVVVLMACFFMAISFVNHYFLRTSALDLGMFNQALYCFSKGEMNYFTLDVVGNSALYFADHFSPLTFIYVPFYYLFGNWTLLIIQVVMIVLAGVAVYKIAMLTLKSHLQSLLCMFVFYANWSIVSSLAFDFHNNVMAAMILPWVYYWYLKGYRKYVIIGVFLMLLAKENTGLWVGFIFLGLSIQKAWENRKNLQTSSFSFELVIVICSFLYFISINSIVMPLLNNGVNVQLKRYALLGGDLKEIGWNFLIHPIRSLSYFFINTDLQQFDNIKRDFHLTVLLSGGAFLIIRPLYFWMLIPIYAQKMLASQSSLWGVGGQYSIEFSVIISFSLIFGIAKFQQIKTRIWLLIIVSVLTMSVNFHLVNATISEYLDRTTRDYSYSAHYDSGGVDVDYIKKAIQCIPNDVPVSVTSCLAPRLEKRQELYAFPIVKNASYIVLLTKGRSSWPLTDIELTNSIKELKLSTEFKLIHDKKHLLIFKRK